MPVDPLTLRLPPWLVDRFDLPRVIAEAGSYTRSEAYRLLERFAMSGPEQAFVQTVLASPALIDSTDELWRRIGLADADGQPDRPSDVSVPDGLAWGGYPGDVPVEKGTPLFPRLTAG